jgi:L-seryl-tRNA(Ser) seleniumtransferase
MMMPGDEKIAAAAIHKLLAQPPAINVPEAPPPAVNVAGEWTAELTFMSGSSHHRFSIEQHEAALSGTHHGDILSSDLTGSVEGRRVYIRSHQRIQGATLHYEFTGDLDGDRLQGVVRLGEYGEARWTAQRA